MRRRAATFALLALAGSPLAAQRPAAPLDHTVPVELNCDALRWTGTLDKATGDELEPAHSLEQAATILTRHKIPYTRSHGMLSLPMPASEYKSIATLPQGEPIIFPDEQGGTICALVPAGDSF